LLFIDEFKYFASNDITQIMEKNSNPRAHYLKGISVALVPLILIGIYALYAVIHEQFRYDERYFTQEYIEAYSAPGVVAMELEQALQTGDEAKIAELQGLRRLPRNVEPNPQTRFAILIEIDDSGYFHYLYFNSRTFLRETHFIKEINGRWVSTPEDLYFYWDSGNWTSVFLPIAIVWWLILVLYELASFLFHRAAGYRRDRMARE
jgi:hypothetical protein